MVVVANRSMLSVCLSFFKIGGAYSFFVSESVIRAIWVQPVMAYGLIRFCRMPLLSDACFQFKHQLSIRKKALRTVSARL